MKSNLASMFSYILLKVLIYTSVDLVKCKKKCY